MEKSKIRSNIGGALGVGIGSAIYDLYYRGFSGIDWYRAGVVALTVFAISLLMSMRNRRKT